tara:strand:- start:183 stop:518 length:336 start_codon:yes stop_codon:yes gene_type:complete
MKVLLEVNTGKEIQKKGFLPQDLDEMILCFGVENVQIEGLMTMAPFTKNENTIRTCFSSLRNLKNKINKIIQPNCLKHLSMGMSNDYEIAIEEGATQVRLGTVLFGERTKI